jgi:hypothetical protein
MTTGWFVRTSSYSADIQRVAGVGSELVCRGCVDLDASAPARARVIVIQAALSHYISTNHDRKASSDIYQLFPSLLLNLSGTGRIFPRSRLLHAHVGDASSRQSRSLISGRQRVSANVGNRTNTEDYLMRYFDLK